MAGLFGRAKSAFAGWNKADESGLTGMQRLGNVGASMQGQGPIFTSQQQLTPGQAPQMGMSDRLNQFGAQLQDIGDANPPPPPPAPVQFQGAQMPGLPSFGQQQNVAAMIQRIYGGR